MSRGYQRLVEVKNWRPAQKLAGSVTQWYPDPEVTDREAGWIEQPHPVDSLPAGLHAYDGRSGGVETQNKGDK